MANPYVLSHTAESIDRKLSLIAENKNLLPYPYAEALPDGLTNVGDGSILTSERNGAYSNTSFCLNHCPLESGKYTVSLEITDIKEEPTIVSGFSLEVRNGDTVLCSTDKTDDNKTYGTFELTAKTTVVVYLNVPSEQATDAIGLLIKPQIEAQNKVNTNPELPTTWVPNMDQIGTYVDRRFNGTNVKIKKVMDVLDRFAALSDEQLQKLINFVDSYVELDTSTAGDDD